MLRLISSGSCLALVLALLFVSEARAGSGGPDAFGYAWTDSASGCEVEADAFVLANRVGFFDGSFLNNVGPFNLGFTFPYYGGTTTQVWVNRSGLVFFQAPPNSPLTAPLAIPTADTAAGFLAAYWENYFQTDLIADALYYQAFPGYFKISWDVQRLSDYETVQWEAYLYPNGDMRVEYLSPAPAPHPITIGIESPDQSTGLEVLSRGTRQGGTTFPTPTPFAVCFDRPAELSCGSALPISCGITNGDNPNNLPNPIEAYGCGGGNFAGTEAIYQLSLTELSDVTATLTAGDRGKGLFLLRGCDEWDCIDGGGNTVTGLSLPPGDYTLVVDATRRQDEGPFTLDLRCTPLSEPISCDEVLGGTTLGQPNRLDGYSCLPGDFSGPESFYVLDFPGPPGNINLSLASGSSQAVFVFDAALPLEPRYCLRGGVGGTIIYDPPAGTYLIVVDGPAGSGGPFTLQVNCAPQLRCSPGAGSLPCNISIDGDTSLFASSADFYRCSGARYSGGEAVYSFTNPVQQVVSLSLDSADDRLDLLLLRDCNEGSCLEIGDRTLDIELEAGTYILVVDGREGAEGPFTLSTICGNTIEPDFIQVNGAVGECFTEHKTAWLTPDIPRADVLFAIDLTGSMGEERARLQQNMQEIIDRLETFITDVAFGLVSYKDYVSSGLGTDPCRYSADGFGGGTDYPYRLEQPITTDRIAIQDAVNNLPPASGGADGPESYSRVLWESANDPAISWRGGSRRLLVNFGDELPHDCNVQACLGGDSPSNRGVDLGRDGFPGGGDDIEVLDAIQEMRDANIALLHFDSGAGFGGSRAMDGPYTYSQIWDCWARLTGGIAQELNSDGSVPGGLDIAELVGNVIQEQGSFCPTLELRAEPGFEDWLRSASPQYVDVQLPGVYDFDIEICVPAGTPPGQYSFEVQLLCAGGVVVVQQVVIDVVVDCRPAVVTTPSDETICVGESASLDGRGVSLVNCDGVIEYAWRDSGGALVGVLPLLDVSPSADETYTLDVTCSTDPSCSVRENATVTVHSAPVFAGAAGRDLQTCNLGIGLNWPPAIFPSGSGHYNVYRSESSCADALTRAAIAEGIVGSSFVDATGRDGRFYFYVVEAEDSLPNTACVPGGPVVAGSITRSCIDPSIAEVGDASFPAGVYTELFVRHLGQEITAWWTGARLLEVGETFRLLKTVGSPTNGWSTVNGTMDLSREYTETDPGSALQFFDLRVSNACEILSLDEYPPTFDR